METTLYRVVVAFLVCEPLLKEKLFKEISILETEFFLLTLLYSEWPKLHRVLAVLSAIGLTAVLMERETIFHTRLISLEGASINMYTENYCHTLTIKTRISVISEQWDCEYEGLCNETQAESCF